MVHFFALHSHLCLKSLGHLCSCQVKKNFNKTNKTSKKYETLCYTGHANASRNFMLGDFTQSEMAKDLFKLLVSCSEERKVAHNNYGNRVNYRAITKFELCSRAIVLDIVMCLFT